MAAGLVAERAEWQARRHSGSVGQRRDRRPIGFVRRGDPIGQAEPDRGGTKERRALEGADTAREQVAITRAVMATNSSPHTSTCA